MDKNTSNDYIVKKKYVITSFKTIDVINFCYFTEIIIPSRIREIKQNAFSYCHDLSSVEFEKNSKLISIGDYSFFKTSIKKIIIPSNVKYIGEYAFSYCKNLKTVEFEENSKINKFMPCLFYNSSIETLSIPNSVIKLNDGWCKNTPNLNNILLSPDNNHFKFYKNDFLIDCNEQSNSYHYLLFARRNIKIAVIPSFIKGIYKYAFNMCKCIQKVEFSKDSNSIEIDEFAFAKSSISKILVPPKVNKIGEAAFYQCNKIQQVVFDEYSELSIIGKNAFQETSISSFLVPLNARFIDKYAFFNCKNLKIFGFHDNIKIKSIDKNIFACMDNVIIFIPVDLYIK